MNCTWKQCRGLIIYDQGDNINLPRWVCSSCGREYEYDGKSGLVLRERKKYEEFKSFQKIDKKERREEMGREPNDKKKKCIDCGITKDLDEFAKNHATPDGYERFCKDPCAKNRRQRSKNNKIQNLKPKVQSLEAKSDIEKTKRGNNFLDDVIFINPELIRALKRAVIKDFLDKKLIPSLRQMIEK